MRPPEIANLLAILPQAHLAIGLAAAVEQDVGARPRVVRQEGKRLVTDDLSERARSGFVPRRDIVVRLVQPILNEQHLVVRVRRQLLHAVFTVCRGLDDEGPEDAVCVLRAGVRVPPVRAWLLVHREVVRTGSTIRSDRTTRHAGCPIHPSLVLHVDAMPMDGDLRVREAVLDVDHHALPLTRADLRTRKLLGQVVGHPFIVRVALL
mmetsp:Transcript_85573/g.276154  ORF Transcript_85573/g.276154 Transcript_85573/m.276154 type:complete len:207 (+) Transcript_85573:1854-2474(+)